MTFFLTSEYIPLIIVLRKAGDINMNERIKKIRKTLDLTQQKLADRLGVKRNTVAQWELGINSLTDAVVNSICREFGVDENWLRTGEGEMFIKVPEEDQYSKAAASILKENDALGIEGLKLYYALDPDEKKAVRNYILSLADAIRAHEDNKEE